MDKKIILASASPRRRELLGQLGLTFSVQVSEIDETVLRDELPEALVKRLAIEKAKAVFSFGTVVIAADTVVAIDDKILGKPQDDDEAVGMLRSLSGRSHHVYTGFCVYDGEKLVAETVATEVVFAEMSDDEIARYVASGEPMDKAGAYGIQGGAARFVSEIRGDYYNVVGLPLCRLATVLKKDFLFDF